MQKIRIPAAFKTVAVVSANTCRGAEDLMRVLLPSHGDWRAQSFHG